MKDDYKKAQQQMVRGKKLVVGGFTVSLMGIISYCVAGFNPDLNQKVGVVLNNNAGWLTGPSLAVIALGTVLWLVGSFMHLNGAMVSNSRRED